MGRVVRRVPANWQHPQREGKYIPLNDGIYLLKYQSQWDEEHAQWAKGFCSDWEGGWKPIPDDYVGLSYEEYDGSRPEAQDYMPVWSAEVADHLMMYEDTTEGTPISPAFKTAEELATWLAETGASAFGKSTASYEGWLATIQAGGAVSLVVENGQMMTGVDFNAQS